MPRALIIHHGSWRDDGDQFAADEAKVLQATPLLRVLANYEVTWLTSTPAAPLLWGNPLIERVLAPPARYATALGRERFDLVINLEATPGCCALADRIRARRHAGYTWNAAAGRPDIRPARMLDGALLGSTYQDWLFALIDRRFLGERYVLGYRPRSQVRFDIGLNHLPAGREVTRAWPPSAWAALRQRLVPRYAVSVPLSTASPLDLIDWVHSCRTVVTLNDLGLHAALALERRVVPLLTPAEAVLIPLYGHGSPLTPADGSTDLGRITPQAADAAIEEALTLRQAG